MEGHTTTPKIKEETEEDDDVVFLQEIKHSNKNNFNAQVKTKTEKAPGPRNAEPSEINNVLAPPAYPMRYLLVVNGKAEYTDSISSDESQNELSDNEGSSSESSDEESASSSDDEESSSSSSDNEESSSSSDGEEFIPLSDSGSESFQKGKKRSIVKYQKPVRKVVQNRLAEKEEKTKLFQTMKGNIQRKKNKTFVMSDSEETDDETTETAEPPQSINMLSTSKVELYKDIFGTDGEASDDDQNLSSKSSISSEAKATETDEKDKLYAKLNIQKKKFRIPKVRKDSNFSCPSAEDSTKHPPTNVSKNISKRPYTKGSQSIDRAERKIDNRPKQIHPVSAPPGKDWQKEMSKLSYKAAGSSSATMQRTIRPQQSDKETRNKFINSLTNVLEKRLQQSNETEWAISMDSLNETCTAIESETWKFSKRYNEQFRALKSNLSDSTNNDFWRDILMGKISPREAATMSSVDMASQAKKKQREEAIKLTTEGYVRNAMENRERETKLRLEKKVHRGEIVEKTPEANDSQFRLLEDFKKDSLTALPPSDIPPSPSVQSSPSPTASTETSPSERRIPVEPPKKKFRNE